MGKEIRPIEITDADTTPVVAASMAPTKTTAIARPPRTVPNNWPMVSSRSSAMPDLSSTSPMRVKNGTASKVSLAMMPKMRCGSAWNSATFKRPSSMPTSAKSMPLAARAKATGKPINRNTTSVANMMGAMFAVKNSMVSVRPVRSGRERRLACSRLAPPGRVLRAGAPLRRFPAPGLLQRKFRRVARRGRGTCPSGNPRT
ncbi:hypothetical protein D3C72_902190 [compost metagenome]